MEEKKENGNIRQRIEKHARKRLKPVIDILDRGDDMRKEGTLTHAQIAKETGIQAAGLNGVISATVGGLAVVDTAYEHIANKPSKAAEKLLPSSPAHTSKTTQDLIKEFQEQNLGDKGHAEKIEGKEAKSRLR
jgi:hypothetical protein